ncbi:hypothetical protein [Sporosarcina jiandibaonis]|uniref:hypothetical protein n=1 Tax=Sporosarcina jiandibaonis TaxID=2715535 RepID=UPI0015542292|nr:hypothetical protein [Sporosarcina jiandibaonis]
MSGIIKKTFFVKISDEESIPYIKSAINSAKVDFRKVKGNSFDLLLEYSKENEQEVNTELQVLKSHKIVDVLFEN